MNGVEEKLSSWALVLFLLGVGVAQFTYYIHGIPYLLHVSFYLMTSSIVLMLLAMTEDMRITLKSHVFTYIVVILLMLLYVYLRQEIHRFDFGVGDASDYYIAGVCSVTYEQDIGFFMPLMASLIGVGYGLFGLEYAPWISVIVYAFSVPLSYFIFRALNLSTILAMIMTLLVIIAPSSIWFAKTSFSEVPWQLFLLIFIFLTYKILHQERLYIRYLVTLYLLLFLAPFIRGEGALYYGLVIFVGFYHFWKYTNIKALILIILGLFILSISIQITVAYKEAYLLGWQFSRVIPNITVPQLMTLLYGVSLTSMIFVAILYRFRKGFSKLNIMMIVTILAIVFKLAIAYIYAKKKSMTFEDMYFFHEFELAVGNFGYPLSILMVFGLVLMHIRAIKGDVVAFTLTIMYIVFYLPFVMQSVTFEDVHAFFFYWNRYYFNIFMMIHLFALGITVQFAYGILGNSIQSRRIKNTFLGVAIVIIGALSMNPKLLNIMITESHQKGSYKLYPWIKEKVGASSFSVVYDKSIIYKQNKAHLGTYNLKTLINRAFSTLKIYAKEWEPVSPEKLKSNFVPKYMNHNYVLCLSGDTCQLSDQYLMVEDRFTMPIKWREHYGLSDNSKQLHHGDVTQSVVNSFVLHAVLYKKIQVIKEGESIQFKKNNVPFLYLLKDGWTFIKNRNSAFSPEGKGTLLLPKLKDNIANTYSVNIRYAIINASKDSIKSVKFSINGEVLKEEVAMDYTTKEIQIDIPKHLFGVGQKDVKMDIEASPRGQIMLRSITINTKGKQ